MQEKYLEIADHYERQPQRGFPSVEVRVALLQKAYSDTEAILAQMGTIAR